MADEEKDWADFAAAGMQGYNRGVSAWNGGPEAMAANRGGIQIPAAERTRVAGKWGFVPGAESLGYGTPGEAWEPMSTDGLRTTRMTPRMERELADVYSGKADFIDGKVVPKGGSGGPAAAGETGIGPSDIVDPWSGEYANSNPRRDVIAAQVQQKTDRGETKWRSDPMGEAATSVAAHLRSMGYNPEQMWNYTAGQKPPIDNYLDQNYGTPMGVGAGETVDPGWADLRAIEEGRM